MEDVALKAKDIRIEDMLQCRPDLGSVSLLDSRTLLLNTEAIGNLRKDLIHNLGYERAKGFLLRYGRQVGVNDGLSVKKNLRIDDVTEALIAGASLFTLEGFGRVEHTKVEYDPENRTLIKNGRFINSFEAEEHIRCFGLHNEPVCWMLIGHATGYCSSVSGEDVYFIETKCVGKGDPCCEFEGKTFAQWGGSQFSELRYYEDRKIIEELEFANKRIREQNESLSRSLDMHYELYQLALREDGFDGITEKLAKIVGGTVVLFNRRIEVISHNKTANREGQTEIIQAMMNRIGENLSYHTKPDIRFADRVSPLAIHKQQELQCVILPIFSGRELLGFVAATAERRVNLMNEISILLHRSTDIYSAEFLRQKRIRTIENEYRQDFIDSLFNKKYSSAKALEDWGERLGFNIKDPYFVIVVHLQMRNGEPKSEISAMIKADVKKNLERLLKIRFGSMLCAENEKALVVLLPALHSKPAVAEMLKQYMLAVHSAEYHLLFGISEVSHSIEAGSQAFTQAKKALKVLQTFEKKNEVLFFDELGVLAILLDVKEPSDLIDFMKEKLGRIIAYDETYESDLVATLEYFLLSESNQKASEAANLSLSGFKYRINLIKDLGYDLQSTESRFDLLLALKIYRLYQVE